MQQGYVLFLEACNSHSFNQSLTRCMSSKLRVGCGPAAVSRAANAFCLMPPLLSVLAFVQKARGQVSAHNLTHALSHAHDFSCTKACLTCRSQARTG